MIYVFAEIRQGCGRVAMNCEFLKYLNTDWDWDLNRIQPVKDVGVLEFELNFIFGACHMHNMSGGKQFEACNSVATRSLFGRVGRARESKHVPEPKLRDQIIS